MQTRFLCSNVHRRGPDGRFYFRVGLREYWQRVERRGEERLWPGLKLSRDGYGQDLSKRFGAFNRQYVTKDKKKVSSPVASSRLVKNGHHALDAGDADPVQEIVTSESSLPFGGREVAAVQKLPADAGSVSQPEALHQVPCSGVCGFGRRAVVVQAPAMPEAKDDDPPGHGTADILPPCHSSTEPAGQA